MAKWVGFLQVSRSGYYAYMKRRDEVLAKRERLSERIRSLFTESNGTYGPGRICGLLRKENKKASYRKVSKIMSEMKLSSIHNRHKTRSLTDSRKSRGSEYKNLIRGNQYDKPRKVICSDITYLKNPEGWQYLCIVKDIVSGEILGESMSRSMKKELVIQAFLNAQARHMLAPGIIYHSDRGSQFTSQEFMELLKINGIKQSFSRVGMPGDNAWAESFFATLKKECVHYRQFKNCDEQNDYIFAWIEGFYNSRRVQARLGYMSPREYYNSINTKEAESAA